MRVIFQRQEESGPSHKTVYPDDRKFFSNVEQIGNNLIADYTGKLPLQKYIEPEPVKDPLTEIKEKIDFLATEIETIKEQTKKES